MKKMKCSVCKSKTKVHNSRPTEDGIRRYRYCVKCRHHFNTLEVDEEWLKSINGVVEMAKQAMPMRFARVDNQKARSKKQKPTSADVDDNITYNPPRKKRSRLTGCKQRAARDALTHSSIYTTNYVPEKLPDEIDDEEDVNLRDLGL
jgi:transcriptional regulator NrdR family protein